MAVPITVLEREDDKNTFWEGLLKAFHAYMSTSDWMENKELMKQLREEIAKMDKKEEAESLSPQPGLEPPPGPAGTKPASGIGTNTTGGAFGPGEFDLSKMSKEQFLQLLRLFAGGGNNLFTSGSGRGGFNLGSGGGQQGFRLRGGR